MNILLLEPFYSGSHRSWASAFQEYSAHNVEICSLPGRYWKWRMHGGAVSLADRFNEMEALPDLILATDMLDLGTFLALSRSKSSQIPCAIYFHENQITYPWSPADKDVQLQRNNQYGFINYTSALAADQVFFNSHYHLTSFLENLPSFLKQFPDHQNLNSIDAIAKKSKVLHLGVKLFQFDQYQLESINESPILLWNHRWEYDKNPDDFFETLFQFQAENIDFQLVVLGENYRKRPPIFDKARIILAERILHFGYTDQFADYAKWLWRADILPVSSQQDFFGGSVVEALYCNCVPILPNRLAYPEHLPKNKQKDYFYDTKETFYQCLKHVLLLNNEERKALYCREDIMHYDWNHQIKKYDQIFADMVPNC
ncbi:MAG: DUF3524 domain-containing protein [Bacteroidota bacterium]